MKYYLGLDTSCYTTSVAVFSSDGGPILDKRRALEVGQGEKGLRQSEGVFKHLKNIGELINNKAGLWDGINIAAVAASVKPRPVEGSYMPVFTVGENIGRVIAALAGVPFYATTHQENHLRAGLWSAGGPQSERFLTVHASGGTTELLYTVREAAGFRISKVGGTMDINAGQFIDRAGVAMGVPFPCGPHLERIADSAKAGTTPINIRCFTDGTAVSFSGPETGVKRILISEKDRPNIALGIFLCIAQGFGDIIDAACKKFGLHNVLMVGGVSSNKYINKYLRDNFGYSFYFPRAEYCSDNAMGTAITAYEMHKRVSAAE